MILFFRMLHSDIFKRIPRHQWILGGCLLTSSLALYSSRKRKSSTTQLDESDNSFRISVNFMEKLANKSYLHYFRDHYEPITSRPPGIPDSLRIITIDVPELRDGFRDGPCEFALDKIYADHIAPNKKIGEHIQIPQKAFVKTMFDCVNRNETTGVQVMEASVFDLNPKNLTRNKENEYEDAPWNQYAWKEEMKLRISGQVYFGAPMQEAKWYRKLQQKAYEVTVNKKLSFRDYIFFWTTINEEGVDEEPHVFASNKPHAVIANGESLALVPDSLRLIERTCRENGVLLYIMNDPRSWSKQKHSDFRKVLKLLHKQLKRKLVTDSLKLSADPSVAFERGRRYGKLETTAKYEIKNQTRAWWSFLTDRTSVKPTEKTDWSKLDSESLKKALAKHGIVTTSKDGTVILTPTISNVIDNLKGKGENG